MKDNYTLVEWPESQLYMEEKWFQEEAILALGNEEKTGSSAYFIPTTRYFEHNQDKSGRNLEIENLVQDILLECGYEISRKDERVNTTEWSDSFPFEGGMSVHENIVNLALLLRDRKKKLGY